MPWTPADANRHKKGLSARQRRQWSAVANSALQRCLAQGRSQSACESSAIRQANSAVGAPELSTEQQTAQRHIVINTIVTVPPSHIVLNDQSYLTAPVIMIVEGVLNHGLIQADELHPEMWNGVPITVGHPLDATGIPHSARQPDVLATCGLGHVFHTTLATSQRQGHPVTSLRGELWINLAQAAQCGAEGHQAVEMLESQTPLEVSTAFYSYAERATGSFYGVPYQEIHHRLEPDHLALLPNSTGACSIADGCGAPRLHQEACGCDDPYACACHEGDHTMEAAPPRLWNRMLAMFQLRTHQDGAEVLTIEQTDMDLREALYGALAREMGEGVNMTPYFIQDLDVANQAFTYREGERLKRRRWQMEEGLLVLAPDSEDVQRETLYHPVTGSSGPSAETPPGPTTQEAQDPLEEEDAPMPTDAIKRRVDALIANERRHWTELDRADLEALPELLLMKLEQQPLAAPPAAPPARIAEAFAGIDGEAADEMVTEFLQRKELLVAAALQIEKRPDDWTEENLRAMRVRQLEQYLVVAGQDLPLRPGQQVTREVVREVRNYVGRGLPHVRGQDDDDQPPPPPDTFKLVVERQKAMGMLS